MRLRPSLAVTAALLSATVLAACGGGEEPMSDASAPSAPAMQEAAPAAESGSAVTVKTFNFQPDPIEVEVGTTVTWTNEDSAVHTATSGTREDPDGEFDIELAESGGTGEHTFEKAGTYEYFCSLHSGAGMTAKVVVR